MMDDKLELMTNKQYLQAHLSFFALYVSLYENFVDSIEERVKSFLCVKWTVDKDDKLVFEESDTYKTEIRNRRVDEKGNKNILLASMLWLMDMGAIDQTDYDTFLSLKQLRNSYAHELADHVWIGVTRDDLASFDNLFELNTKIDRWWFINIDHQITGDVELTDEELQTVTSSATFILNKMRETLFGKRQDI